MGIGLASYVEITGMGDGEESPPKENATVEVHPDGTATILTGTSPHGQGHATAWAMLASEELGIPVDKITLKWGDTDLVPEGGGTGGSRSLQHGGSAVRQASQELLEIAKERAASELEASAADLRFDVERSAFEVVGDPDASVPLGQPGRGGAAGRSHRVHRTRARRSRSGHTSRSSMSTPRPERLCCAGS